MDATTENAVERVRRALLVKREAALREQKAHEAYLSAKELSLQAVNEAAAAQQALSALLVNTPPAVVPVQAAPEPKKPAAAKR